MKKINLIILLMMVTILPSLAAKSYEMEVRNLVQVNETEFTFDVRMRNTNVSEPFAIEAIQWQLSYNASMLNGGSLNNDYLTYVNGTSDLEGANIIPQSNYFSTGSGVVQWVTAAIISGDQTTLFNTGDWKRIGTFRVQLRNSGNTAFHNFADVAHSLAFVPSQVIVNWCNYTTSGGLYYRSGAYFELISSRTLTNSLSSRQLAGYCFTGTGTWSTTARWNNVTTANFNTLPGATNNVLLKGSATVADTRTVKDVTIAQGGYLVINPAKQLTADNLYNDNTGGGSGTVTLANWDFENVAKTTLPYSADGGLASNINIATMNITGSTRLDDFYQAGAPGAIWSTGSRAPQVDRFYRNLVYGSWTIQITTSGYSNIKLSSQQYIESGGPSTWKIQWSLNGSTWNDVSGGGLNLTGDSWSTLNNLTLPENLNDQATVYLRWSYHTGISQELTAIDNVVVTGTGTPTGLLIESTSGGTGSLIHNTTGVEATVQRYIAGWSDANHGWHFLSSPVAAQPISVFHTAGSGNDFYKWVENEDNLKKWVNRTATGGGLNPTFETNFVVGRGYLMANSTTTTPVFTGVLGVESVPVTGLTKTAGTYYAGWHLLGNPFSSALGYNLGTWGRTNVSAIAQIWKEADASYTVLTGNQEIPAMNGFMVYTTGSGSLTIPADARVHSSTSWYKSEASGDKIVIRAEDPEAMTAQETILAFNDEATDGFDLEYDSYFMAGFAPSFYSKSGGSNYALNTLPGYNWDMVIPLGFIKNASANFTIRLAENIPGLTPHLRDLKLNTDQDLSRFPVYNFTAAEGDDANRFQLCFSGVGMDEAAASLVNIYGFESTIYIASRTGTTLKGEATVYNMMGQNLKTQPLDNNPVTKIAMGTGPGYYLVKVTTPDQIFSGKVFIN